VRRENPQIGLFYEGHGSHPSPAGSYLAACVLYATIFRQTPVGLPAHIVGTPVDLDTEKPEADKTTTLVDLTESDAAILQIHAWTVWEAVARHGGYPEISPPDPPALQPLPTGLPLSEAELQGTWRGTILFYPVGPVEMILHIQGDKNWSAALELKYHSKDFADEAVDLSDFRVEGSTLSFSDPKSIGVDNLEVHLTGVMPTQGELQGTARSSKQTDHGEVVLLGSWSLKKLTPQSESSPN
jgi:hypothetical protein